MKSIILHLSDAHFSDKARFATDRVTQVVSATYSVESDFQHLLICFSGDIAATGSANEYSIALEFLSAIRNAFQTNNPSLHINIFTVPGNHDCDFTFIGDAAKTLAQDVVRNEKSPGDSEGTYRVLLNSQANYHIFDRTVSDNNDSSIARQLYRDIHLKVKDYSLRLRLFNTAILSGRHEVQGELWFPLMVAGDSDINAAQSDLAVSMFHHPYVWLESNNSVKFRQYVEAISDLVLTGHQHAAESFYRTSLQGTTTWYSAGAALQGANANESGFSVFVFNFEERMRKLTSFVYNGALYVADFETDWQPFTLNANARKGYVISDTFNESLDDPESLVVHSQKKHILLRDIYEPPRMKASLLKVGAASTVITADTFANFVKDKDSVFIFGENLSGKTCLAKVLYKQMFQGDGSSIPILLSGKQLKSSREDDIDKWIRRAYRSQYSYPSISEYLVLPKQSRIIIVDDWHALRFGEAAKKQIAKTLCSSFATCILMCDVWFQIEELASSLNDESAMLPKNHLSILPLSPYQKTNMIQRWITLGREDQEGSSEYFFELDAAEKYLDELSRNKLLPQYPLYVLSALQTFQAVRQSEPDLGAQGVLFDLLVGSKLNSISVDAPEVDINRHFMAFLAGDIFEREESGISEERAIELADAFFESQAVPIDIEALLRTLVEHKIVYRRDGFISFRQRYMYYYFVAENFVTNLGRRGKRDEARRRLTQMAALVAFEEYAQVLMFVIYKTKDADLIDELIINSKFIFASSVPCDFESDIEFLNHLQIEIPSLALPAKSVAQVRAEHRSRLASTDEANQDDGAMIKREYEDELDVGAKVQFAFKSMQMMGRVLRNFPGALDAEVKKQLATATYEVGLRMMKNILSGIEENLEQARELMVAVIDERSDDRMSPTERLRDADKLLTTLVTTCSVVVIRSISSAVGSSRLAETYRTVGEELGQTTSAALISIAIKLNHFRDLPVETLLDLESRLKKNHIAYQVLRTLVWQRLVYLPVEDRQLRQRISKRFGISSSSTPILLANAKVD